MPNSRNHDSFPGDLIATTRCFVDSASPRLVEAMKEYLARLEEGEPVNRREFLERYADIADELEKCLGGLEFIQGAAPRFSEAGIEAVDSAASGEQPLSQPVGDFRILREIGRGGMWVVYEAEQLSLSQRTACK